MNAKNAQREVPKDDMYPKMTLLFLAAGILSWRSLGESAQDKTDKTADQAKQVCEKFAKAFLSKNLDETMKFVAVPWYDNADDPGKPGRLISDAKELKNTMKKLIAGVQEPAKEIKVEVLDNLT